MRSFFTPKELQCSCCGENKMDDVFLLKLNAFRLDVDSPLRITSGYRCKNHNKDVGGAPGSYHLHGCAVDIARSPLRETIYTYDFLKKAFTHKFSVGIAKSFFHIHYKPFLTPIFWIYEDK